MRLRINRTDLPLTRYKMIEGSTVSVVRAIIVELDQDGLRGYGEVAEESLLGTKIEEIARDVEGLASDLANYALADPRAFNRYLASHLSSLSARCALEMAACDLWGKITCRPLRSIWPNPSSELPLSSYTITQDNPERMIEKFEAAPKWPLYRLELGSRGDIEAVEEIRHRTDARLRVDLSGQWRYEDVLDLLGLFAELKIEMIEQPLPPGQWGRMKVLKENSPIPIYADESCLSFADIDRCAECFHGVNLRPVKFGGLILTYKAIQKAKSLGLKTLIGNVFESTVSASAVAQFAPILDDIYIDGPYQIEKRGGIHGVTLVEGQIVYPDGDGCGVTIVPKMY